MSTTATIDKHKIIKQGWLHKKGKHLGDWRKRWVILTREYLYVRKEQTAVGSAKTLIKLSNISVSSFSGLVFQIKGDDNYLFKAEIESEKMDWINCMVKYTNNPIKMPINIECHRDNTFNNNFEIIVPFDDNYPYPISTLMADIMDYVNKRNAPFTFFITRIKSDSFIGRDMHFNDYDWTESDVNITNYERVIVEQIGIRLEIDMEIYTHKISSIINNCKTMTNHNELCPIYARMRYQDIFTEEDLNHLYEYNHPDTKCKYGDQCYAYKRLEDGGNELKDRAHVMIYTHPLRGVKVRGRQKEIYDDINSFCLNEEWYDNIPLYQMTSDDKKEANYEEQDGCLTLLMKEVIDNGYKADLCLTDEDEKNDTYSLITIVNQKLQCMRHKRM
eukprot:332873_1